MLVTPCLPDGRPAFPPMTAASFVVRNSAIHGRGAFASRPIQAGEEVGEYTGERITREESQRRFDAGHDPSDTTTYQYVVDDIWIIDGRVGGNDTRFINHGCSPNCKSVRRDGRIFFHALRDIAEGQELLLNYKLKCGTPASEETKALYACYCGSPECCGTLISEPPALPSLAI